MKIKSFARLITFMCVITIMMFTLSVSFADEEEAKKLNSGVINSNGTFTELKTSSNGVNENVKGTANTILGFVQFVGYAIAVGMLIYVGIKYVMASADEKANLKNSLIRYVIGAILIAGASAISGWVFALGEQMK